MSLPSSWSSSLRFELQFTGESINLWGDKLNTDLTHADYTIAGWLTKALTVSPYSLTTANAGDDEARAAMIKFTGTGAYTVTIPSVSKAYSIWNACTDLLTISTGAGTTVIVQIGEIVSVICDGSNVKLVQPTDFRSARITSVLDPTGAQDAATKAYVDATAFSMSSGSFPGQTGNAGKFIQTDGSVVSWQWAVTAGAGLASVVNTTLTVTGANASAIRAGTSTTAVMTPGETYNGLAEVTLTSASNHIAADMATFVNGFHQMTENTTLDNPSNSKVGQTGYILGRQHASAAKTLAFGANWKRVGGSLAITTTTSAYFVIHYEVTSAFILYDIANAPS